MIPLRLQSHISECISSQLPTQLRAVQQTQMLEDALAMSIAKFVPRAALSEMLLQHWCDPNVYERAQVSGDQLVRQPINVPLSAMLTEEDVHAVPDASHADVLQTSSIGNMFLSSCPGKKVRLDGAMHGRAPICRDLKLDLTRIKALGIRAIVCCLDEEELQLIGSPFHAYRDEVEAQGFDLIRLPIVEGYAPQDLVRFDMVLTMVILNYTLRGASVLVHCRGGVGRAGLVGAAWLYKMNLMAPLRASGAALAPETASAYDTATMLIRAVRQRRSLRAIETAEQARFLVHYVQYLMEQERARDAAAKPLPSLPVPSS